MSQLASAYDHCSAVSVSLQPGQGQHLIVQVERSSLAGTVVERYPAQSVQGIQPSGGYVKRRYELLTSSGPKLLITRSEGKGSSGDKGDAFNRALKEGHTAGARLDFDAEYLHVAIDLLAAVVGVALAISL